MKSPHRSRVALPYGQTLGGDWCHGKASVPESLDPKANFRQRHALGHAVASGTKQVKLLISLLKGRVPQFGRFLENN